MTITLAPLQQDPQETIAAIARLLHHASERAARKAGEEGPRSALHVTSLAMLAAAAETAVLVPSGLDPYWPQPTEHDPVELLRAAETRARTVPIDESTAGFSAVVVTLEERLREVVL